MSKLVVIDAGHGGKDSGAVNGGKYEKAVALATAKLLKTELEKNGFRTLLTRDSDIFLELSERCRISNNAGADIFISIHCNSATNKTAEGIETWRYSKVGQITKALAENVQKRMIDVTGARNRGVKEGNLYVVKNTKAPAILVEMGFISNAEESVKLFKTYYQSSIAKAICQGVIDTVG